MSKEAVETARKSIRELMEPMFAEAEDKGLWFYTSYQGLWFSPKELREQQANGRLLWGPVNWTLRDPQECIDVAQREVDQARTKLEQVTAKVRGAA